MSRPITVYVVTEGQTEQTFVRNVLAPYLAHKGVFLNAALFGKPGHKGGSLNFQKATNDISNFLSQRSDTYISTMFDFFRIDSKWPGLNLVKDNFSPSEKATTLESAMSQKMTEAFSELRVDERFIPYISMYEFEALLFSNPQVLSQQAGIQESRIQSVLDECGEPEAINSRPEHAPSKRLGQLANRYKKTITGITAANAMGIDVMREKCPHFNDWVSRLEALAGIEQ